MAGSNGASPMAQVAMALAAAAAAAAPASGAKPAPPAASAAVASTPAAAVSSPLGAAAASHSGAASPLAAAVSSPAAGTAAAPDDIAALVARGLLVPVGGVAPSSLRDTFAERRDGGGRPHQALDIMAPRGTRVVAAGDGRLVKLFTSVPGGLTIYQFDPSGSYAYYYAHLDRYADGVKEGMALARGDLIGYVGVTGNSAPDAPHLHFAIFRLGPEKQWWKGVPVDPYPVLNPSGARR